jgi:hypothetical protein
LLAQQKGCARFTQAQPRNSPNIPPTSISSVHYEVRDVKRKVSRQGTFYDGQPAPPLGGLLEYGTHVPIDGSDEQSLLL